MFSSHLLVMFRRIYPPSRLGTFQEPKRYMGKYKIEKIKPLTGPNEDVLEINSENQQEALKNVVAPFWSVPYSEQLSIKDDYVSYVISQYFSILKDNLSKPSRKKEFKIPPKPKIKSITPSPVQYQYRSRDTYMVRPGLDGDPKTVGHIVGRPSEQKYICVPPVDILSPSRHIKVAEMFQHYIRSSQLPACTNFSEGGNWTQLQVRSNNEGETMALIKIHPQQLTQAEIEEECQKLKEYFDAGPGSICQLSSLYFQASPFSNASSKLAPYHLLSGNKYLMEKLSGREFALSPASFFQCNRKTAEIMYDKIFETANLSPSTSILDLGCGIGTISVLATPHVRGTVGVDISAEAIQDAKLNARLNGIFTANFTAGSIERKLKSALEWLEGSSDIVAILNPGRCGVEVSAMKLLRDTPQIRRIIYVACQPDHEWVIRNVLALIKPQCSSYKSAPLKFKSVIPVDMFPQTTHCELIMRFDR